MYFAPEWKITADCKMKAFEIFNHVYRVRSVFYDHMILSLCCEFVVTKINLLTFLSIISLPTFLPIISFQIILFISSFWSFFSIKNIKLWTKSFYTLNPKPRHMTIEIQNKIIEICNIKSKLIKQAKLYQSGEILFTVKYFFIE